MAAGRQNLPMSQLFDAFKQDTEAVERMKNLIGEIQQEAKEKVPEIAAIIEKMESDPSITSEYRRVLLAGLAAGRGVGVNECAVAIFGQGSLNTQVEKPEWWDALMGPEAPPTG